MANSIKETKVLFEGFRRFAIKEAEAIGGGEEKPDVLVRIFDFDGTVYVNENPDVAKLIGNPYMASLLKDEDFNRLLSQEGKIPENITDILKDTKAAPVVKNFIISKVSAPGLPKVKLDKVIAGIRLGDADANFSALNRLLGLGLSAKSTPEEIAAVAKEKLKVADTDFEQASRITDDTVKQTQEEKINQIELRIKDELKLPENYPLFEKSTTKVNTALTKVNPETAAVERIAGTSGKAPSASAIAERIVSENPNKKIAFELYDNSTTNIREMEKIIALQNGEAGLEKDATTESKALEDLRKSVEYRENVTLKKFRAVSSKGGYSLVDLEDTHYSASKGQDISKVQESGPLRKFQIIKNKFQVLINLLKTGGEKKKGRPAATVVKAIDESLRSMGLSLVEELFDNLSSYGGTTGLEEKYKSTKALNELKKDVIKFVQNYSSFKTTFDTKLGKTPSVQEKPETTQPTPEPEQKTASTPKQTKKTKTTPSAESIYEELDKLLSNRKYSFNITTKK